MKVQLATMALVASSICLAAPAQAACGQFAFNGFTAINQSNGYRIEFNSKGPLARGPVTAFNNHQAAAMRGIISGRISERMVELEVEWNAGGKARYTGNVNDEGFARGDTFGGGGEATWNARDPFVCADV